MYYDHILSCEGTSYYFVIWRAIDSSSRLSLQIWKHVQALVGKTGKEGLKRGCLQCDPGKIKTEAAARAQHLLSAFNLEEVRDVSAGAATFYVWVSRRRTLQSRNLDGQC